MAWFPSTWAAGMLALGLAALSQGSQTDAGQKSTGLQASDEAKAYKLVFARVRSPLLLDVPMRATDDGVRKVVMPPDGLELLPSPTDSQLRLCAIALGRAARLLDGAWVLHRQYGGALDAAMGFRAPVLDWLDRLEPGTMSELISGNLRASHLGPEGKDMLAQLGKDQPGILGKLMAGDDVRTRLYYTFILTFEDPQSGRKIERQILEEARSPMELDQDAVANADGTPLQDVTDGKLSFGDGELLRLREALDKAAEVFGLRYRVDGRLLDSLVFVKGKFTEKRFEAVLGRLCETLPTQVTPSAADQARKVDSILKRLWAKLAEQAGDGAAADLKRDLLKGARSMTLGDLATILPSLNGLSQEFGLGPGTKVTVHPDLMLRVCAQGSYRGASGSPISNDVRWGLGRGG